MADGPDLANTVEKVARGYDSPDRRDQRENLQISSATEAPVARHCHAGEDISFYVEHLGAASQVHP
jgi:hypothetical protein